MKKVTDGTAQDPDAKKVARTQAKILKAVSELRKNAAGFVEALADVEELVASGQTSTNAIRLGFIAKWERKPETPKKYVGNVARDNATVKRLRSQMADEDLRARIDKFLEDNSNWNEQNAWSLEAFAANVNKYGVAVRKRPGGRGQTTDDADLFERTLAEQGRKPQ